MSQTKCKYDVVVVGGGPAGIAAACAAAESGVNVGLFEMTSSLGGQIWRDSRKEKMPRVARKWLNRLDKTSVDIHTNATIFAAPRPNILLSENQSGVLEIEYSKLIIAPGARELFVPFKGWTLPGVFGVGGLHNLAKLGWNVKGKRVVLAGSGPLLFAAGAHLRQLGAKVIQIAEQADLASLIKFGTKLPLLAPAKIVQAAVYQTMLLGVPYKTHTWPVEAYGSEKVEGITFTNGKKQWKIDCDYIACAFGLCTNLELADILKCDITNEKVVISSFGETSVDGVYCAGEPTGISGVEGAILDGLVAGYHSAGANSQAKLYSEKAEKTKRFGEALDESFALREDMKNNIDDDTIICRCEDATYGHIKNNTLWREAKLYGHVGMGPCQGRTCGAAVRYLFGWEKSSVRPPIFPVRASSFAAIIENSCQDKVSDTK